MASLTKQQKRAKRAKAKAKQQRMVRSVRQPAQLYDLPDGPDAYPLELFENLFAQFQEAENESRKDLFVTMFIALADVLSANAGLEQELIQTGDPSGSMALLIQSLLIDYREWAYGTTEAETLEWLDNPEVIEDFSQAMEEAAAELAADLPENDE